MVIEKSGKARQDRRVGICWCESVLVQRQKEREGRRGWRERGRVKKGGEGQIEKGVGGDCRRTLIIYNKMPLQHPAVGSDSKTSTAISYSPISSLRSFPVYSGVGALLTHVYNTTLYQSCWLQGWLSLCSSTSTSQLGGQLGQGRGTDGARQKGARGATQSQPVYGRC